MNEKRGAEIGVSDFGGSDFEVSGFEVSDFGVGLLVGGAGDVDTGPSSGVFGNDILLFTQSINGL